MTSLDRTEDRWRGMKTNPVTKSEQGWSSFREKTDKGKRKRAAILFRNYTASKYQRVR